MLRIAVIVFVAHAWADLQAAKQPASTSLASVRYTVARLTLEAGPFHVVDQLLGVEVVVLAEDVADHVALLVREALRRGRLDRYSRNLSSGLWETATAGKSTHRLLRRVFLDYSVER